MQADGLLASTINKDPSLSVVDVYVDGKLKMTGSSLIQTVKIITVGSLEMTRSKIVGNGTANITVNGDATVIDMLLAGSTITGTSSVSVTGNLSMDNETTGTTLTSTISGSALTVTVTGDITMAHGSLIGTVTSTSPATSVSAVNITMTDSTINGSAAIIKATGYLLMTGSAITGASSVTVAGDMTMQSDGAASTINKDPSLAVVDV